MELVTHEDVDGRPDRRTTHWVDGGAWRSLSRIEGGLAADGWVGELAKLYESTAPRSLPMSLGPKDLRPDRFLPRARAVCITEAFSALGIWGLSGPSDLAMERVD